MDDMISRQAAIDLLFADKISDEIKRIMLAINVSDEKAIDTLNMTCDRHAQMIKDMPPAQPTLYGYDLRNLIVFADAVNKKGVSDSEIEDFVRNARAAWEYAWEEFQRTQKEALDSIMRGDHHEG